MIFTFKNTDKEIVMSEHGENQVINRNICWLCDNELHQVKARDQCHLTSRYRRAAFENCNLQINNY